MNAEPTMTAQEQIEYVARKVMGWKWGLPVWAEKKDLPTAEQWLNGEGFSVLAAPWEPLTDWNHWRQVEEKLMEDDMLHASYLSEILKSTEWDASMGGVRGGRIMHPAMRLSNADLPTRVSAVISAHQELYGK